MTPTPLPAKVVAEKVPVRFPFAREVPAGVTIQSVAMAVSPQRGTDAQAALILLGSPQIVTDEDMVIHRVQAGVAGVTYLIRCTATLSDGSVLVRAVTLPVVDF